MVVLMVRRVLSEHGTVRHIYELRARDATFVQPLEQEFTAEIDEDVVNDLCDQIEEIAERFVEAGESRTGIGDELRDLGQLLYATLFPSLDGSRIPELVASLRGVDGPLLVSTDEPRVPWELLHDGEQFLGLRHDLGRQLVVDGRTWIRRGSPVPAVTRVLLVADPLGDLPLARGEAERVRSWLEQHGAKCTVLVGEAAQRVQILRELASGTYDLFHYAGHIVTPPRVRDRHGRGSSAALVLHKRAALLSGTIRSVLAGRGSPPLVFINGCASGEPLSNLCAAFMTTGAAVVVGTLHRVSEEAASGFAETLYANLLAGVPAGRAVREARLDLYRLEDPGWTSFVFHGDPAASIEIGGTASVRPSPTTDGPDELVPGLPVQPDRAAWVLLQRAADRAARRGIATSLDLLVELLAPGGPMRLAAERRGVAARADLAEQVLLALLALSDRAEAVEQVPLSDTVTRVLSQAAEHAVRNNRPKLTVADIAEAFVEVGGGTSARVLESCGVELQDLRPSGDDPVTAELPGSVFSRDGRLLDEHLDPVAVLALQAAALLAATDGALVSSAGALYGFGLAGSPVLRACLEEQGQAGREAVERLFPEVLDLGAGSFSRRVRLALDQALRTERSDDALRVGEATVLDALLADNEATAYKLLERCGVDVARLRDRLRRSRVSRDPPDAAP